VDHVRSQLTVSERRACAVVGQSRTTQRRQPKVRADEAALTEAIVRLATRYGRYGYRRIRRLLLDEGWQVSIKRVYRIWRREGLKVPKKQPKRGRLWLNDGSCIRLRPERPNHVWSYDFMQDRTEDGRRFQFSPPPETCRVAIMWGADETEAFRRQSSLFADTWRAKGGNVTALPVPRVHHYAVMASLGDEGSVVFQAATGLLRSSCSSAS